ncbi:unnamed protein product [Peniophora sp. CBMAI 1063]|nr:unnamed protein product [Peniophora sp. CBMAI 1063]
MAAETANTNAPQDNATGCAAPLKLNLARRIYFACLIGIHSTMLGLEGYNLYSTVNESPASATVEGKTEWDLCAPLGAWSVSWRFVLNVCGIAFAMATLFGGNRIRVRIVAHSMLLYAAWFMTGPFLLYSYAAECAVEAPGLFKAALANYVMFTFYALCMMVLFMFAAFKGLRKARAQIKARKAAAKAAQEAAQLTNEKPPVYVIPEGQLVDVKAEELV